MKKFILIAVCLLLTALITLGVCMYAIGENKDISKPYDMGSDISVTPPEDTPTAQDEMEKKFSVYNHVTEENGKKNLTLFSEEQAEEQWTKRENGEDFRLTYDEILFLISDSLRLYETYDEIVLTNAEEYDLLAPGVGETIRRELEEIPSNFRNEQNAHYQSMQKVTQIAVYRLALLDSRTRKAEYTGIFVGGETYVYEVTVEGVSIRVEPDGEVIGAEIAADFSCRIFGSYWALLPENGEITTMAAYREALAKHLLCAEASGNVLQDFTAEYPVLQLSRILPQVVDPLTFDTTELFAETRPVWELKASYFKPYAGNISTSFVPSPTICLYSDGKLAQTEDLSWEVFQKLGDPREIVDAVLEGEAVGVLTAGEPFLELDLSNGTSVLFPLLDTPGGETLGAAAVVESAAEYGEVTLYRCVPAEFLNSLRMQFMIASNDGFEHGGNHYFVKLPEDYPCVD